MPRKPFNIPEASESLENLEAFSFLGFNYDGIILGWPKDLRHESVLAGGVQFGVEVHLEPPAQGTSTRIVAASNRLAREGFGLVPDRV